MTKMYDSITQFIDDSAAKVVGILKERYGMVSEIPLQIRLKPKVAESDQDSPLFVAAVEDYLSAPWGTLASNSPLFEEDRKREKTHARRFFNKYTIQTLESFDPSDIYADVRIWNELIEYYESEVPLSSLLLSFLRERAIPYALWQLQYHGFRKDILQTRLAMDLLSAHAFSNDSFIIARILGFRDYKKDLYKFLEDHKVRVTKLGPTEEKSIAAEWLENRTELLAEDYFDWPNSKHGHPHEYFSRDSKVIKQMIEDIGGPIELIFAVQSRKE